jgi:diadenosine tetraphosphate (Ap4A) HIT family hydrolase
MYRALVKERRLEGATLMIRSGATEITGASVNHLHAHLIVGVPRTKNTQPVRVLVAFK